MGGMATSKARKTRLLWVALASQWTCPILVVEYSPVVFRSLDCKVATYNIEKSTKSPNIKSFFAQVQSQQQFWEVTDYLHKASSSDEMPIAVVGICRQA